ncbi:MAG TPA: hypothetical protein VF107_00230 [Burkholderiaceae bacterium]
MADLHEVMFETKRAMLAQFLERVTIDLATAITGCTTRSAVQPG